MQKALLPLFPLEVVLLPRTLLPLHIFEDRYKEMIAEAIANSSEFGIVLAKENGVVNIGCTAIVEKVVERYTDGRLDIVTAGRRRFEIVSLDQERAFLRGEVEFFDDDDFQPVPDEIRDLALAAFAQARTAVETQMPREPDLSDSQVSFQLAQVVPDLDFRQHLLAMRSETRRMRELVTQLPQFVAKQRRVAHVRAVAPRNGHAQGAVKEA